MRFFYSLLFVNLIVVFCFTNFSYAENLALDVWLKKLRQDAIEYGISQELVARALPDSLKPIEKVISFDRKQPERIITFETYKNNIVSDRRVSEGRRLMKENADLLREISSKYGVEEEYIVALWGIETGFGKNTGGFDIIQALLTLAYDGRRSAFFRKELLKALKIVDDKHIPLNEMKGSWAGAMGQCQFMPSSFEAYAEDYNQDGRRDIWNTKEDVFASIANYLKKSGWKKGTALSQRVVLPKGFNNSLIDMNVKKTLEEWDQLGIRLLNGGHLPVNKDEAVSIIQPGGAGYKTYIAYNNYRVIMKWNRSLYFATSVGLIANGLKN